MHTRELKDTMNHVAPYVLRVGLALVVIWFGWSQLMSPESWISMVPEYVIKLSPVSVTALVLGNAVSELLFGTLLLFGFYTKIVSGLLTLHLLHILTVVGYNQIGVRDFGLFMAMLSVFLASSSDRGGVHDHENQ